MELVTADYLEFLFFAVFFIPAVLFMYTQYRTIKLVQTRNRYIAPGEVFLQLIPLFGMIWQFFVVIRISNSIRKELAERTFSFEEGSPVYVENEERPAYKIGITYCVLFCCYLIPVIGETAFLAGMICWVIYWIQLWKYKKKLELKRHLPAAPTPRP